MSQGLPCDVRDVQKPLYNVHDIQATFVFRSLGHERRTFPHVHDIHDVHDIHCCRPKTLLLWKFTFAASKILPQEVHQVHSTFAFMSLSGELLTFPHVHEVHQVHLVHPRRKRHICPLSGAISAKYLIFKEQPHRCRLGGRLHLSHPLLGNTGRKSSEIDRR